MIQNTLTVVTHEVKQIHERSGFGSCNQPELRQTLILDKIKHSFNCNIVTNSFHDDIETWLPKIHDEAYLCFLKNAYGDFQKHQDKHWESSSGALVPNHFYKKQPHKSVPTYKLSGFYGSDFMTPIYADTYENALISASCAYTAADIAWSEGSLCYALACSPGHHAKWNEYGGYCFINNGLVAAYRMVELGAKKVAILDVDYHAGNGTSDIVNNNSLMRGKVYCWSIHGDPRIEFPSFDGFVDDFDSHQIKNVPLSGKCNFEHYRDKLVAVCDEINAIGFDAVVVAFGGDTFGGDPDANPLGGFLLQLNHYVEMGKIIKEKLGSKMVITQEGGYDMQNIAQIVCNFLAGNLANIHEADHFDNFCFSEPSAMVDHTAL